MVDISTGCHQGRGGGPSRDQHGPPGGDCHGGGRGSAAAPGGRGPGEDTNETHSTQWRL